MGPGTGAAAVYDDGEARGGGRLRWRGEEVDEGGDDDGEEGGAKAEAAEAAAAAAWAGGEGFGGVRHG